MSSGVVGVPTWRHEDICPTGCQNCHQGSHLPFFPLSSPTLAKEPCGEREFRVFAVGHLVALEPQLFAN